jgi:hypothetical protein
MEQFDKKHLEVLNVMETPDNLILKYIDGDWYLLFGGSFANEKKSLEFYFHLKPFKLNILASTKKIDGCYLLDREVKSMNIGNRVLSLDDIDPLKNHLRETVALSEDSVFNKKGNNEFDSQEPNQEEFYRKGFNDALEISKIENLKLKNQDIFESNYDISENTFFVEINVCNFEDYQFKELTEITGKEQFLDSKLITKYVIYLFTKCNYLIQPTIFVKRHSKKIEWLQELSKYQKKEENQEVKNNYGK